MPIARRLVLSALLLALVTGCVTRTLRERPCTDDAACGDGLRCVEGSCVEDDAECEVDTDCDVTIGETCEAGACIAPSAGEGSCAGTADCPLDEFCNTATSKCQPLLGGWCRSDDHCEAPSPICTSTTGDVPGQCVQCTGDEHCGGGTCTEERTCAAPAEDDAPEAEPQPQAPACPPNSSPVPGDMLQCACDPGYVPDATGTACVASGEEPVDDCVENASPVPGLPGQCACDPGFVPNDTGTACVPPEETPDAGTAPVEDAGTAPEPEPEPEPQPDPVEPQCGPNSYYAAGLCWCYPGFVVNATQDGCEDPCEVNGWYGDGICDDFCPYADSDCF